MLRECARRALLAAAIQSGEVGALKLALSRTINLELLTPHLTELIRLFNRLEVKLLRGTAPQVVEFLKAGMPSSPLQGTSARNGSVSIAGRCSPKSSA